MNTTTTHDEPTCTWCGEDANHEQGALTLHRVTGAGSEHFHDGCWDTYNDHGDPSTSPLGY